MLAVPILMLKVLVAVWPQEFVIVAVKTTEPLEIPFTETDEPEARPIEATDELLLFQETEFELKLVNV